MLSYASGRSEVELGQAAMIGGLLLLAFSNSLMNSYIAGVLLGTGIGTTVSRFFIKMTFGPHILKQKTTQHTYFPHQLISIVSRTPFAMHRQTNHLYKKP